MKQKYIEAIRSSLLDLQKKCENAEISSKSLDMRKDFLDALSLMAKGLEVHTALDLGITNSSFDT